MPYFLLLDNYDEGLELEECETEEDMRAFLQDEDWAESNLRRLDTVIEGKELDLKSIMAKYSKGR